MQHIKRSELFNEIIQSRRSTFPYQFERGKHIPDETVRQILENANRAPNHKKTEPWRFTVFTGEGLQRFSQMQAEIYTRYAGDKFKETKLLNLTNYPLMSSHVIAIGMKRSKEHVVPEIEEIIAIGCAVENIYLSVNAYGLGGYLSTGGITYLEEAKPYFDLEPEDKLIGFFFIGYPASIPETASKRQPVEDKAKWILE
ncbi:MAG TPA: nitroreductase [Hanamia sp.]